MKSSFSLFSGGILAILLTCFFVFRLLGLGLVSSLHRTAVRFVSVQPPLPFLLLASGLFCLEAFITSLSSMRYLASL
jgi:hypothetical protein